METARGLRARVKSTGERSDTGVISIVSREQTNISLIPSCWRDTVIDRTIYHAEKKRSDDINVDFIKFNPKAAWAADLTVRKRVYGCHNFTKCDVKSPV